MNAAWFTSAQKVQLQFVLPWGAASRGRVALSVPLKEQSFGFASCRVP
jgi:hypothetical protein